MSEQNEIDLGATNEERYGGDYATAPALASKDDKKYYPSFHYSGRKELDLPEDGKMTIEYCKTSEKSIIRDGVHYYECDIEVRRICEVEGEEGDDHDDDMPEKVEDILDGLMEKLQKEKE
jgi:hypothetical protein